jgi:large subunit ribosomal protein L24
MNNKIKIKKGDNVLVISGENKGQQAVVKKVITKDYKAILEGVNLVKRHVKPTAQVPGGIVEKEAPIHISNLMLVDKNGVASRVEMKLIDGNKVRVSKKSKEVI